jgi:hypothetical protein
MLRAARLLRCLAMMGLIHRLLTSVLTGGKFRVSTVSLHTLAEISGEGREKSRFGRDL